MAPRLLVLDGKETLLALSQPTLELEAYALPRTFSNSSQDILTSGLFSSLSSKCSWNYLLF